VERLLALIRAERPDWKVLHVDELTLGIQVESRAVPLPLRPLYQAMAAGRRTAEVGADAILSHWLRHL
jgi:hypothetical protein